MLSIALAHDLRRAGLAWSPAPGDRFHVPDRDLDGQVFVVSEMVISVVRPPAGGELLAFNGTTEWALDSLEADEALWLPREDQLRTALGPAFVALSAGPAWAVDVDLGGALERVVDDDVECALARALLRVLDRSA